MATRETLLELALANGVSPEYWDIWGNRREVPDEGLRAVLHAMGVAVREGPPPPGTVPDSPLPAARVLAVDAAPWVLDVGTLHAPAPVRWEVVEEGGARHAGELAAAPGGGGSGGGSGGGGSGGSSGARIELPALPTGYHRIALQAAGRVLYACLLIVVPRRAYEPEALQGGRRLWGPSVQLYALRSRRNWGIGDFSDLRLLAQRCAAQGASLIGLNPLHALRPDRPGDASPYSPSSRRFLNFLYIDVEAVDGFAACAPVQEILQGAAAQATLARLRAAELVDYEGVADFKRQALELLYAAFRSGSLAAGDASAQAFRAFQSEGGLALRRHALFEALQERFAAQSGAWGWPAWPRVCHDPHGEAASLFARENIPRIEFFEFLQWQAAQQLARVRDEARDAGLAIGLYQDLAVSVDSGGAESWADSRAYAQGVSVGCPPDDFNLQGQDWGLPPFSPRRLREAAFAPYIAMLRACMRNAGALRIDHVMGLARLFWIPHEGGARHGAYVSYPFDELLGILALESVRNRCMVVGEDLGTVPDEVRGAMHHRAVACYRVLLFTRRGDGGFSRPWEYPDDALATATTHDLATLAGWWEGRDIALREELELFPRPGMAAAQLAARAQDRGRLLEVLREEGLDPGEDSGDAAHPQAMGEALHGAVQEFLGRSNAPLLVVQLEDIFGCREQVNLPGTVDEYPNWRRRLPVALEDWDADGRWDRLARRLRPGRGGR
jgi:(1->4)-alpha-D-glucan 1-alpha-D-glucosylmutase